MWHPICGFEGRFHCYVYNRFTGQFWKVLFLHHFPTLESNYLLYTLQLNPEEKGQTETPIQKHKKWKKKKKTDYFMLSFSEILWHQTCCVTMVAKLSHHCLSTDTNTVRFSPHNPHLVFSKLCYTLYCQSLTCGSGAQSLKARLLLRL